MRALFVGLGSIGQRHLRNLKFLMREDVDIYALRRKDAKNLIIDSGKAYEVKSIDEFYGIQSIFDIKEAFKKKPDMVFITNPSSLHVDIALVAAKNKCNLFIEKPLSNSYENIAELQKIIKKENIHATVAYQSKYNPGHKIIKDIIKSNQFGEVISANFKWGTFLPDHHPYEDYKKSYASRNDLGGGVVLGLSHEIDIIRDFFGIPTNIEAKEIKEESLNLEVEDNVHIRFFYSTQNSNFDINLYLSYAQPVEERFFEIEFSEALIINNLITNEISIKNKKNGVLKTLDFERIERDRLFIIELKDFIKNISNKDRATRSFDDGVDTLKICLKILEELKKNK